MDPYATHIPVTALALAKTSILFPSLPILECGCGDYSTPVIELLKGEREHDIFSSDQEWFKRYEDVADSVTQIEAAAKHQWGKFHVDRQYGLCLLDSEEFIVHRMKHIPKLLETCHVVVMHDARPMPGLAKFDYLYTRYEPNTWVGSNSVDVGTWFPE